VSDHYNQPELAEFYDDENVWSSGDTEFRGHNT
jgi:hypothetical protein